MILLSLDMDEDMNLPIILGRAFFVAERALIDVKKRELKLRVQEEKETFNVFNSIKYVEDEKGFCINKHDFEVIKSLINQRSP